MSTCGGDPVSYAGLSEPGAASDLACGVPTYPRHIYPLGDRYLGPMYFGAAGGGCFPEGAAQEGGVALLVTTPEIPPESFPTRKIVRPD